MQKVCAAGLTTKGIDIYHGNHITDMRQVIGAGVKYAFIKAWEYHEDSSFKSRWMALKAAGIIRGAYDYFHPSRDPVTQAKNFLAVVGQLNPEDLPCALDWESADGMPTAADRAAGLAWLQYVEQSTGKTPIIYTGPYFGQALSLDHTFARFPLWVAHYGVKCPSVPAPWVSWTFWQGTDRLPVPGMSAPIDGDVFNGTLDQLKSFAATGRH